MSKGQRRGNREPKKPKQKKAPAIVQPTVERVFAEPTPTRPKKKPGR